MESKRPDLMLFLASAAHDMKNSVGVMSGTLETLLEESTEKQLPSYQSMAHMLYETKRLNDNLIQLLALYKKVGSPAYPFDPQSQLLSDFVEQVEAQSRVLLDSKGITFETDVAEDLIWIFDDDLVLGVIGHAINNAIRYTHDKIRLLIAPQGDLLEFRVEDNGSGYPAAMLDASQRKESGVNFKTGSTGLGLFFSNEVARTHQHRGKEGSVTLENGGAYGGGCFVLRLP